MSVKVLIVEDEFIVANDLRVLLIQAGYQINGIAASAEAANESIQRVKPDLVLLDIQLQGIQTGIDLARKLRAENIAFIFLSAYSNQKVLEEAKTTEPYGFLVKPFRETDLLVALDIALYRHRHSLESRLRQEEHLKEKLAEIGKERSDPVQALLKMARVLHAHTPFDMIVLGSDSRNETQPSFAAYLRVGFDEYQFIGEKELITITGLKKIDPSLFNESDGTETGTMIYSEGLNDRKRGVPRLQRILSDFFRIKSYIVLPVTLSSGLPVLYLLCSRQNDAYTLSHTSLITRIKDSFKAIAEKLTSATEKPDCEIGLPDTAHEKHPEKMNESVFKGIVGKHPLLLAALDLVSQVAPYNTSVLILGESGTGKEKVAHVIHSLSPRTNGPFVKINCAAIPENLIESELFGHEKGAFTGAIEKRKGRFEQADGGTVFLDEIGELLPAMQVKLLRVLQEREIEYVGGSTPIKVNVRMVAATNRNLEKEVAEGNFRLDLYYRLNVFPVTLPPLRERKSDIEALAVFFAKKYCKEFNKSFKGISNSMLEAMSAYSWPGNIRELGNVLEQSVILHDGKSDLELKRSLPVVSAEPGKVQIETFEDVRNIQQETERAYIISVLLKANGRIRGAAGAAELLHMKPTTLEAKMAKLNINRADFMRVSGNK